MNVTSPGFTLFLTFLAAALHGASARAASREPPTFPGRLLISAGAAAATSGFAFSSVLWLAMRGARGLDKLGPTLLALLLAFSCGLASLLVSFISTRTIEGACSVTRWSVPLGYGAAAAVSAYAFTYGW